MQSVDLQLPPSPSLIGWKSMRSTMRFSRACLPPLSISAYPFGVPKDCRLWPLKPFPLYTCAPHPRAICYTLRDLIPDEYELEDLEYEYTREINVLTRAIGPILYAILLNLVFSVLVALPVRLGGGEDKSLVILLNDKPAFSTKSLVSLGNKFMDFATMLALLGIAIYVCLGVLHLNEVNKNKFKRQNEPPRNTVKF